MPELHPAQISNRISDSASNSTPSTALSPNEKKLIESAPRCIESNGCQLPDAASELPKEELKKQEKVLRRDHERMKRAKELLRELLQKNANLKEAKKEYSDAKKLIKLLKEKGALSKEMEEHVDELLKQGKLKALKDPKHSDEILLSTVKEVRELLNTYLDKWNESIRQSTLYLYVIAKRSTESRSSTTPQGTSGAKSDSAAGKLTARTQPLSMSSTDKKVDSKSDTVVVANSVAKKSRNLIILDVPTYQLDMYTPDIFVATELQRRAKAKKEGEDKKDETAQEAHDRKNQENVQDVKRELEREIGRPITYNDQEIPHCPFLQSRDSLRFEMKSREHVSVGSTISK